MLSTQCSQVPHKNVRILVSMLACVVIIFFSCCQKQLSSNPRSHDCVYLHVHTVCVRTCHECMYIQCTYNVCCCIYSKLDAVPCSCRLTQLAAWSKRHGVRGLHCTSHLTGSTVALAQVLEECHVVGEAVGRGTLYDCV